MLGGICTDLLVTVALLFLTQTETQCRAENNFSLVTLPEWRTNSEYVTKCFYDRHNNVICDWTRNQLTPSAAGDVAVNILESGPLGQEGEACLEFWYLAPVAAQGSELRALLKSSVGEVEIWTSPALPRDSWRQVFVPFNITEQGTQVVFKAVQAASMEGQVEFNQIGVRRGSCGQQCETNTEFWTDEFTRCLCSAAQLSCSSSQCPQGQICGPQRGRTSGIYAYGTCSIHSNKDSSTFDGARFRFMTSCTYTLAKKCSLTEALPMFNVEVVNEQSGNSSLSTILQVNVEIGKFRVSLMKSQAQRVVVNGIWRKLPLNLSKSTINIMSNSAAVTLGTSFGLAVSYDNGGAVHVNLPSAYSDHVCGLCGNFNHLRGDSFSETNSTNAQDAAALAESWQTGETTSSCEAILVPHQCDPIEEVTYASELYCGRLLSTTGPFADCLSVLGAESYFRDCVVGMCFTNGDPAVLCETFRIYAEICQEAGIALPTWRNSTLCPIQCGENSHYNSCADGCPVVCSSLDVASSCGSCEERCECDSGYKLSGGKCVLAEDCGCWYKEKHYERGETVLEGECVEQCQCMGNNDMQCNTMQCAHNEVCKVKGGVKGCFSFNPSTCSVYGDPHYITFDGMAYSFQGGCKYTLTTTCGEQSSVRFTVIGHNMYPPLETYTRSKLEAVSLQVDDLNLILNQNREVYVNNVAVQLPYSISAAYGSVSVHMENNYIILESTFGLRMMIDGQARLFLQVDERYKYELCGLCGTYSDQQDDDFITPGGENVTEPSEFGDSWRVQDDNECTAHPNDPRLCDYEEENDAYNECYTLLGDAFKPCHELLHPSIYLTSCVYDYCATGGDRHTLCESLKSYAAACQVAGVQLPDWQTDTACACPINCTFENSLCGWEQLTEDNFDWTRNSGPTPSQLTGPDQDHTTGAGFYMYIDGRSVTSGDSARLLSSMCHYSGSLCLHFWYHMYGSATAMTLNIYLLKNNKATKLWSMMNNQGLIWHPVYLDIEESAPFQIIAEGIRGSDIQSDVAIDDISITFGSCSGRLHGLVSETKPSSLMAKIPPSHPVCNFDCSFDSNLCSWNQMITDAFDWTWQSGSTPTQMTGPSADHTGDGHYLYIEASSVTHGDTARLISPDCLDPGPQCLQFWYHMSGSADTMGLNVYLLQNKLAEAVWSKRTNQGDTWQMAQVDFTTTGAFQIIFEGHRGSNEESDVAIDDVKLYRGRCSDLGEVVTRPPNPDGNITAPPSGPTPTTPAPEPPLVNVTVQLPVTAHPPVANVTIPPMVEATTNLINKDNVTEAPVCQLHCNFEQDLCQWSQVLADVFDWTRHSGSTPTMMTGPSSDHTTGDGYYLYIEANRATHGDTARLISSECSDSGPQCLQFWYHMYGSADTMGLHVYLLQDRKADAVWSKRNDQANMWHLAQVDLTTTGAFQIIFEGQRGSSNQSDVAIDDVSLHRGHCADLIKPTIPTTTTSSTATQPQSSASLKPQPPSTFTAMTTTRTSAATDRNTISTTTPATTVTPKPSNPDVPTTRPQLPVTSRPITTATIGPQTTRPHPPTTEHAVVETLEQPKPAITERPQTSASPEQPAATATPQPPTTAKPQPPTTARPQPPTTARQQPPTTAKPQPPTTARPQPPTTAKPQPPTTAGPQTTIKPHTTTARPQPPTTAKPQPQTTVGQQPLTTVQLQPTTAKPQPTTMRTQHTTAGPELTTRTTRQPPITARPQPPTTARPQPPTETPPQTTAKLQPPTTAGPQPPTEALPQPQTTVKPQPPITSQTESQTTNRPQPDATTTQKPPATARPQPSTTAGPQPPTTTKPQPQTTTAPQPPTTAKPQPQTTDGPQPPSTVKPQLTTAPPQPTTALRPQSTTTATPQWQTTATPRPPKSARPQPTTTTQPQSQITDGPQPPNTVIPQTTTATPQSTTTAGPKSPTTAEPQLQTVRPQPPTESLPQPQTTAKPQPPPTARPQPPTTTKQQPPTETQPQQQTTIKPHPTTGRPRPTTSATSHSTTTARPQPSTTPAPSPSCPQNSHYTTCIPACNPTCTHLNGPPRCSENEGCVQGCVCNEGFVQKGKVCVPIQQCGCLDRNGAVHQFNEVWYTNHCSQKCECEKHHGVGEIDCDDKDECDGNAVCLQNEEGDYYCQSTGFNECTIKTDHEYRTFDKMEYDFEGEHSYVLVQTKNLPNNLPDLYIVGINTPTVHDDDGSQHDDDDDDDDRDDDEDYDDDDDKHEDDSEEHEEHQGLQELKIRVYNHTVEFKKKRRLVVDGRRTHTPVSPTAGLNIHKRFSHIYLKTDFGLLVEFDGRSTAEIILPRIYKRKVGGLCGNFDGQKRNDWMKPDGTRATSVHEFGESWRV